MAMHDSFSPGRADFTRDALPGFKDPDTAQDAQAAPRFIEDRPAPVDHAVCVNTSPREGWLHPVFEEGWTGTGLARGQDKGSRS